MQHVRQTDSDRAQIKDALEARLKEDESSLYWHDVFGGDAGICVEGITSSVLSVLETLGII